MKEYFRGLRHALTLSSPTGPTPFQVLDVAMRFAEPRDRPAVLDAWRAEYPLVTLTKRQRKSLEDWAVEWRTVTPCP